MLFDRGVVDALGMLDQVAPLSQSELSAWLSQYPYSPKVFVFPPWKEIYTNDAERDHTFEHAESVYSSVQAWYRQCGYRIVDVPRVSVAERCTFVLQALASGDG